MQEKHVDQRARWSRSSPISRLHWRSDGNSPTGLTIDAAATYTYGTSEEGGTSDGGIVLKLTRRGYSWTFPLLLGCLFGNRKWFIIFVKVVRSKRGDIKAGSLERAAPQELR